MSSLIVQVASVKNLRAHPNADKLDVCEVLGWQMCVAKGKYKNGDKVVYFPADTCIPEELAKKWDVSKYLKNGVRVSKVQLRGEPSFGLTAEIPPEGANWIEGQNVAEFFGATKYEPPVRPQSGDAEVNHPLFEKYTDMENIRNFPDILQEGEQVVFTEKLHGTNCRVGLVDGVEMAGSKELRRKRPADENMASNIYWFPLSQESVKRMLHGLSSLHNTKQVILFGEVYGGSIQSLDYGVQSGKGFGFRAFDLLIDGKYVDYKVFEGYCKDYGVETVPVAYEGPFSMAKMKELSDGPTLMGAGHIREGVVGKPLVERQDAKVGRVILKYVGDVYLFGKNSDFKDM